MTRQVIYFWIILITAISLRFYFFYTKPLPYKDGDKIRITAKVRTEPIRYERSQYIKLLGLKTYLSLYPQINYGDRVMIEGIVDLQKGELKDAEVIKVQKTDEFLFKFRQALLNFYRRALTEPHASLVAGMTIGSKSGIPEGFWEALKASGTAHVVVASGMNVTLVAGFLINFFVLIFKRKKALFMALLGIWSYALLSGLDAPIVRAAIMGSIAFSAQELGRINMAFRALIMSAVVMLFVSPGYLEDVGFLLSFFATLGLILFEGRVEKVIFKGIGPLLNKIKTYSLESIVSPIFIDLSTTIAAQIGVFPILLYYFGYFNFFSPICNMLILWTVVPITILGMIGGIAGIIFEPIGTFILWLTYPLTSWFIFVVSNI